MKFQWFEGEVWNCWGVGGCNYERERKISNLQASEGDEERNGAAAAEDDHGNFHQVSRGSIFHLPLR